MKKRYIYALNNGKLNKYLWAVGRFKLSEFRKLVWDSFLAFVLILIGSTIGSMLATIWIINEDDYILE